MTAGVDVTSASTAGDVASAAIPGDGDRQLSFHAVDQAGNEETPNLLTVRIDRVPPTISASRTPGANLAGWNKSAVTVEFTCADALSGIASCAASKLLDTQGAAQSASGDATDLAGNTASASATGINIDLTAPLSPSPALRTEPCTTLAPCRRQAARPPTRSPVWQRPQS